MISALRRWGRAALKGWDAWIATAVTLNGTQPDPPPKRHTEPCTLPAPAAPGPVSEHTERTSGPRSTDGTSPHDAAAGSRYPHPPARPATTYPSPL